MTFDIPEYSTVYKIIMFSESSDNERAPIIAHAHFFVAVFSFGAPDAYWKAHPLPTDRGSRTILVFDFAQQYSSVDPLAHISDPALKKHDHNIQDLATYNNNATMGTLIKEIKTLIFYNPEEDDELWDDWSESRSCEGSESARDESTGDEEEESKETQEVVKEKQPLFHRYETYVQSNAKGIAGQRRRHKRVAFSWPPKKDRRSGLSIRLHTPRPGLEKVKAMAPIEYTFADTQVNEVFAESQLKEASTESQRNDVLLWSQLKEVSSGPIRRQHKTSSWLPEKGKDVGRSVRLEKPRPKVYTLLDKAEVQVKEIYKESQLKEMLEESQKKYKESRLKEVLSAPCLGRAESQLTDMWSAPCLCKVESQLQDMMSAPPVTSGDEGDENPIMQLRQPDAMDIPFFINLEEQSLVNETGLGSLSTLGGSIV